MGYSLRVNAKNRYRVPSRLQPAVRVLTECAASSSGYISPSSASTPKSANWWATSRTQADAWEEKERRVFHHDFRTDSMGVAIPYGLYDVQDNRGALIVGVSHDTSAFAAHSIAYWWSSEGSCPHRRATGLWILAHTGGSNGYRTYAWKTELQSQLANAFGLAVTVAHYPTGASKWNPIEPRLFSAISLTWAGEPLNSYQKILNFARTTTTKTGLAVTAYLDRRNYLVGLKSSPDEIAALRLQRHEVLPHWNYSITSQM
jgi:hypothetical protein